MNSPQTSPRYRSFCPRQGFSLRKRLIVPTISALGLFWGVPGKANQPALPGNGFAASRYQSLWEKPPFATSSADTTAQDSPDYDLVGIAQFDGVPYASLIDKKTQNHFILCGDRPEQGLTLVSISRGKDSSPAQATMRRNGELITLKLKISSTADTKMAAVPKPQIRMPGSVPLSPQAALDFGQGSPPPVAFRAHIIRIPPRPEQNQSNANLSAPQISGIQSQ